VEKYPFKIAPIVLIVLTTGGWTLSTTGALLSTPKPGPVDNFLAVSRTPHEKGLPAPEGTKALFL
jgi:hypothetical protein